MNASQTLRRSCTIAAVGYALSFILYLLLRLIVGDGWWWLALLNSFMLWTFLPLLLLLPLALVMKTPRVFLLLSAILAVAVVAYAPRFLPKPIALASGTTLRVVTFNIWGSNQALEAVETWLRATNADVVLLQEIPPAYAVETVPHLADIYEHQFFQTTNERYWGNGILSRYPLIERENVLMGDEGLQQRVVIEVEGQQMVIYNVHFYMPQTDTPHFVLPVDYPYLNIALLYDDPLRNRQIQGLLDAVRTEQTPTVVGGDFNMSDSSVFYNTVAAEMHDSFREAGVGFGLSWPNARQESALPQWLPAVMRIDYIWYRGDLQATVAQVGPPLGSDHLPVLTTLLLP
ncbi:MAG: endonuclease/exonuclease/phosphatase family protein [Anaerolineae bacterium]